MSGGPICFSVACFGLLALSLLNVVIVSRLWLWRLGVATTEFGHWLALPTLLLAGVGVVGGMWIGAAMALGAAGLLLMPLLQARRVAARLPGEMARAFGRLAPEAERALPAPFSWRVLAWGRATAAGTVERFVYAEREGGSLSLDFHRPAGPGPAPCVVFFHGGGWEGGSPGEGIEFTRFLVRRGYAVAAVQYRLAPAHRWPAPGEDAAAALRWLKERAGELGIDPGKFVLFGRSAGGQIAAVAAYAAGNPAVRGCIAAYAPSDMVFSFRYATPGDILDSYHLLIRYLGGTPEEVPEAYRNASPLAYVGPSTPPTLLLHGRHDPLVWFLQSERLAARLRDAGVPCAYLDLKWATHAFDYDRRTPGGQLAAYATAYFLAAATGEAPLARGGTAYASAASSARA